MTEKIDRKSRPVDALEKKQILFTLDLAGNFKYVNSTAEQIFGYSGHEICAMNIADLVAPGFTHYLQGQMTRAGAGEVGSVYEIELYTKDGTRLPLEISMRLVLRDGAPFELEGIACPLVNTPGGPARCLDEEFWIGPGLNSPMTLTFIPTR
jgi:PAS domain S-box-containing protein